MDKLSLLRRLISDSSDPDNPGAEEVCDLLERARNIAVVGLSRFPEKAARRVPAYLAAKGFEVTPVNPNATRILGRRSYPRLADVPDRVDLVVVFRPSREAGQFVEEALRRPDRPAIWLQEGIRADTAIASARATGVTAVQDLCVFRAHRALPG